MRTKNIILATVLSTLAGTAACNNLLDVDNPGRVPVESLSDPSMAGVLDASALGSFECAFAQYVATAGVLSGEYVISNFFVDSNIWGWRGVEISTASGSCPGARTTTSLGFYSPMQTARFLAEKAITAITDFTDAQVANRTRMLAELHIYDAYAYVLLGEGMCQMTVNGGPAMTKQETWKAAVQHFTDGLAFAQTANNIDLQNMARVGRARAELDLGDLAAAATDAQAVPAGYVRNAGFSETTPARENRIYNMTVRNDFLSVGPNYRNLTVAGRADPRVKAVNTGRLGQDGVTPQWQQQKYTGNGAASIPIASWIEAQLIYAEAVGGQAAKDAINRVRTVSGVPALDGSEGSDIAAIVLEERRRQLFSEGHRLGDMLRKNVAFPSGVNHKGQSYGPVTCVPLPLVETQNNPNFKTP